MTWWSGARCVGIGVSVACLLAHGAGAQPPNHSKPFLLWPSGAVAFPTGRFGKKDENANPPKDGHKTGFNTGLDLGYQLNPSWAIGIGFDYARFGLDFVGSSGRSGRTSVSRIGVWARYFLAGGYKHWKPYVCLDVGLGRPKVRLDYDPPAHVGGLPTPADRQISTIKASPAVTGGLGVLAPLNGSVALFFEPRYTVVSTAGKGRKDEFHLIDGSTVSGEYDQTGARLRDKSNTNWWELRAGVVISLL